MFHRFCFFCLILLGTAGAASAQAPTWQFVTSDATSDSTAHSEGFSVTTDSSGNVFVTGSFYGQVNFGSTTLVSAGWYDMYLAKWDVTTGTWVWAVSGGGGGIDRGLEVAVSGHNVYVTGYFTSDTTNVIAGTNLPRAGGHDIFLAKYVDNGSSVSNGWVVSGGGLGNDGGSGLAIVGANVYVTGSFSGSGANIAGTSLTSAGYADIFLAKYIDTGPSARNAWVVRDGGPGSDEAFRLATRDTMVYVTGSFSGATSIAGTNLPGAGGADVFVARYVDRGTHCQVGGAVSGGGNRKDGSWDIAVNGPNVYVTGYFDSRGNANFAGTSLTGMGDEDMFVAKYLDTGAGLADGWVTSGGGTGEDMGRGLVVSGAHVFVTGQFFSSATIAGTSLISAGHSDMFLAKYLDTGPGFSNEWVRTGNGVSVDFGNAVTLSGPNVYVTGMASPIATFGSLTLNGPGTYTTFLAGLTDLAVGLSEETSTTPTPFTLSPNPAHHTVHLSGAPSPTATILDATGRVVLTSDLSLPTSDLDLKGLPPGLYLVRCGPATRRLVVE